MKYTKPDIILQSVTRLEEQNAWEIKIAGDFPKYRLAYPDPADPYGENSGRGSAAHAHNVGAADEAQRIIITDLLATAALNADWLDENVRAAIYNAFPNARP